MMFKKIVYLCVLTSLVYAKSIDIPNDSCVLMIPKRTISEVQNLVDFHSRPVTVYKTKNGGYAIVLGVLKLHAYKANIDRFQSLKVQSPDRYKMYSGVVCTKDKIFTEETFISLETISLKNSDDSVKKSASSSAVPLSKIKDFNSAIQAYDLKKDIAYLKKANSYATNDRKKAILERKFVDYLGVDKVFDVQITNSLGTHKGYSYAGMFSGGKGSEQDVKIFVKVIPRENLPITLKYNTYTIFLGIKEYTEYSTESDFSKKEVEEFTENIPVGTIDLKPSNHYSYSQTIDEVITVFHKAAGFLNDGGKATLNKLDYTPVIDIYPSNATIQADGLKWQNYYPFTSEHQVKFINSTYAFFDTKTKKYCKNLTIDNGGWRMPTKENLKVLASSAIIDSLVGTQDKYGKELYYTDTDYKWRPIDFKKKGLRDYPEYTAIRCVKSAKTTLYDKATGLEWENQVHSENAPYDAQKYCKKKGDGWRLPTPKEQSDVIQNQTITFTENNNKKDFWWTSRYDSNANKASAIVEPNGKISTRNSSHSFYPNSFRCVRRK